MVIIPLVIYFQLTGKVLEGIESMRCVEALVVLSVAALYLSIMPGSIRADAFMADSMVFQPGLKECQILFLFRPGKAFGKFRAVIRLDAFNGEGKGFDQMIQEHSGGIRVVLLKGFYEPPAGVFVNRSVLVEFLAGNRRIGEAYGRNKFHVDLDTLSGVIHRFIGFRNILGIGRFHRGQALFPQEAVQAGNGALIPPQPEFHPEDDKAGVRVSAAHPGDESDLIRGMLIGMMVRAPGTIAQGIPGAVITAFPAVDVLAIGFVLLSSFGNAIFFSVTDKG